jgi:catechol 2,3-dioxygenase-like lactoylglutathione lyase family enzyme
VLRIASVTIDCHDVERLVRFWAEVLHYRVTDLRPEAGTVEDPGDRDVEIVFVRVPEGKTVKNRVHLDLGADDMEHEVHRLVGLGAERGDKIGDWTVMRDPEGNEFCVIQVSPDDPVESWRGGPYH